jgi:hypothetical protein
VVVTDFPLQQPKSLRGNKNGFSEDEFSLHGGKQSDHQEGKLDWLAEVTKKRKFSSN